MESQDNLRCLFGGVSAENHVSRQCQQLHVEQVFDSKYSASYLSGVKQTSWYVSRDFAVSFRRRFCEKFTDSQFLSAFTTMKAWMRPNWGFFSCSSTFVRPVRVSQVREHFWSFFQQTFSARHCQNRFYFSCYFV